MRKISHKFKRIEYSEIIESNLGDKLRSSEIKVAKLQEKK